MKISILPALAALGALLTAASAGADTYLKGELGGGFSDQYDVNGANVDLSNSWLLGGAVGTNLAPHIRVEGELLHSKADLQAGGHSTATAGFANGYYDFGDGSHLTPFVGGGLGYGKFDTSAGKDDSWAWQLAAGVAKTLSPRLSAELAYRYVEAPDLSISGLDANYHSSFVTAGLRWKFGG
jgi:opacity protein-like surface antigen